MIYLGCDHLRKNKETKSKLVLIKKYFYMLEKEKYKNFKILAKAFNSSKISKCKNNMLCENFHKMKLKDII